MGRFGDDAEELHVASVPHEPVYRDSPEQVELVRTSQRMSDALFGWWDPKARKWRVGISNEMQEVKALIRWLVGIATAILLSVLGAEAVGFFHLYK